MDLDTLLRETASVADPTPESLAAGRSALKAAALPITRRVAEIGRARSRRMRRLALIAMLGTAASVVVVISPTVDLGNHPVASANAAELLLRAGAAAGAQPGGWPDAAYWHSVSSYSNASGASQRREIWIGHRQIGVLKDPGVAAGVLPLDTGAFPVGASDLTWDELYALPTDAGALERQLRNDIHGVGRDDNSELFTIVGDLLRESPAPPPLRKALWEVAARIPEVSLVGAVTDSVGRSGVAVERGGLRYVIDPNDGRLLEEANGSSQSAPEVPNGSAWLSTYLEQGPADSAPAPESVNTK